MRKLFCSILIVAASGVAAQSMPSIWEVSPLSPDNSPLKWENSPHNWDNSIVGSQSGLYNGAGRQIGYATTTPSGATNVYLNNGHRIGYIPEAERPAPEYEYLAPAIPRSHSPSLLNPPATQSERQVRRRYLDEDDDDYIPVRRVTVRSGFTPLERPKPGFTPIAPPPMKSGFTPIEEIEPVRSGFTPLE